MASPTEILSIENCRWHPDDISQLIECCAKNITKLERINIWRTIACEMATARKKSFLGTECKKQWYSLKRLYDTWKHSEEIRIKFEKYFILMDKALCKPTKELKPHSSSIPVAASTTSSSSCKSVALPQPRPRISTVTLSPTKIRRTLSCNLRTVDEEHFVTTIRPPPKYEDQVSETDTMYSGDTIDKDEIAEKKELDVEAAKERRHKEKMDMGEEFLFLLRRLVAAMGKDSSDVTTQLESSPSLTTDL